MEMKDPIIIDPHNLDNDGWEVEQSSLGKTVVNYVKDGCIVLYGIDGRNHHFTKSKVFPPVIVHNMNEVKKYFESAMEEKEGIAKKLKETSIQSVVNPPAFDVEETSKEIVENMGSMAKDLEKQLESNPGKVVIRDDQVEENKIIISDEELQGTPDADIPRNKQATIVKKDEVERPPLGLTPRYIHDEGRLNNIKEAIIRYLEAGKAINPKWIEEYNELVNRLI